MLLLFAVCISANGQSIEREELKLPNVQFIRSIDYAKGYFKDGNWLEFDRKKEESADYNVIPVSAYHKDEISYTKFAASLSDNFKELSLFNVEYNQKEYFLIVIQYMGGSYKYPKIKRDWEIRREYKWVLLEKNELYKLDVINSRFNEAYELEILAIQSDREYGEFDMQEVREGIAEKFNANSKAYYNLYFQVFPIKSVDVLRFLFEIKSKPLSFEKFDPLIFDRKYFEVDFNTFNEFIKNPD